MKTRGKKTLHAQDNERYGTVHEILAARRQQQVSTANVQSYMDNMQAAYKSYASAMKNIRANLETATQGLAAIDEKGMSDKIIESIDAIAGIRQEQMAATSAYSTQMAGIDSERISYLRENGTSKDRFIVEQFEERIRQENAKMRIRVDELDHKYQDIETDLYRDDTGRHREPTEAELLSAKREMDHILEEKSRVMEEYAGFMQKTAVERNDILHDWTEDATAPDPETTQKAETLRTAFADAETKMHSRWETFKSLPVIAHLSAVGVSVGKKMAPVLHDVKSDLLTGYAAMKENRQLRKVEKTLSDLDRSQGRTGEESYLSKFKASLQKDKPVETPVPSEEINVPENVPDREESVETQDATREEPAVASAQSLPPEHVRETRMRRAANKAVIESLNETGLRRIINDYYWTDLSGSRDIVTELGSSENAMNDLNRYVDRVKGMISHWPNAKYRENMMEKLNNAMMQTYNKKSESEKKVSAAEARIRDSEDFLRSLDMPAGEDLTTPTLDF